ncbi:hypothetical protein [Helicobacter mustelae]|nr:hypothetical protein [Helicobacter mustelae]
MKCQNFTKKIKNPHQACLKGFENFAHLPPNKNQPKSHQNQGKNHKSTAIKFRQTMARKPC